MTESAEGTGRGMASEADREERLRLRLRELEGGRGGRAPSARTALLAGAILVASGIVGWAVLQGPEVPVFETGAPEEFQTEGPGFGDIVMPPAPEPVVTVVEVPVEDDDGALLALIETLRAEIASLRDQVDAPTDDPEADAAIAELTARIEALQAASEAAEDRLRDALGERDLEIERLRAELDLARLAVPAAIPAPSPFDTGPSEEDRRLAELERRRQAEEEARRARIASPILAYSAAAEPAARDPSGLGDGVDFAFAGGVSQAQTARPIGDPGTTVPQGTVLQAVLETALDSAQPGAIRAIVSEDVHSLDGRRVLIPRGSRLIGRYQSGLDVGQRRVLIAWDRILLPGGRAVRIGALGGDELGRSGTTGAVDTRLGERLFGAALVTLVGAGAAGVDDDDARDAAEDGAGVIAGAAEPYLSLGPRIRVPQGARVTVMVDRDLVIP